MRFPVFVAACLTAVVVICCSCNKSEEKKSVSAESAVVDTSEQSKTPIAPQADIQVIDFYATWCGPCRKLTPIVEKMEKKYAGKINFSRIDIDKNPELAEQYGVSAIPTLVYIKGADIVDTSVGLLSEEDFDIKLSELIAEE